VAKQEIIELQEELSMVRKDKMELEDQLKDALDMVRTFSPIYGSYAW